MIVRIYVYGYEDDIEVDDNSTNDDIQEEVEAYISSQLGWEIIEEDE